jgi:CheY-like chemotaxis protein
MSDEPNVLVVEDDEDDFFFTRRVLQRHAHGHIFRVDNGRDAISYLLGRDAFADREKFPVANIVLLDLKMGNTSGLDVLAALREHPPAPMPRIVVLTGSNEPKDREMVKNSGVAAGYIVKPLNAEHLPAIFGAPAPAAP